MTDQRKAACSVAAAILSNEITARRRRYGPGELEAHAITDELGLIVAELRGQVASAEPTAEPAVAVHTKHRTGRTKPRRGRSLRSN